MKKNRYLTLALALSLSMAASAQQLFVGSYNVRYQNDDDAQQGDGWTTRSKVLCAQVDFEDPDIFGTQEVLHGQLEDMRGLLDGYDYIGVGRDDGKQEGEYAAIFYKKERLTLHRNGHFWLNETPDRPALGWDAACIRICTWGEFEQKSTGFKFLFFDLHMDHVGIVARREAAKLVVAKIREIAKDEPAIVTGDFNVDQNDSIFTIFTNSGLLVDSYVAAERRFAENGTFNDFDPNIKTDSRIDHVFVSPQFAVHRYGILTNSYWTPEGAAASKILKSGNAPQEIDFKKFRRRNPSDHYPVFVKLEVKK